MSTVHASPGPPGTTPTAPPSTGDVLRARRRRRRGRHRRRARPTPSGSTPTGCTLLPGFVDLHTHLREPGREDAETIASGSRAAAVGGFTAVLAMANTNPVTDTAEAAERILDLGRAAGLVDVVPVGAVTKGLDGRRARRAGPDAPLPGAASRVFSDDGHCVADGRVMRRALEYVRAFDGVVSQHSQDPQPGRAAGLLPRGRDVRAARPARLAAGRRGQHHRPRRPARRAHRQPGCTSPTSARPRGSTSCAGPRRAASR